MTDKLTFQQRCFLFWHGERCIACGKQGFVHSWSRLTKHEQFDRTLWGQMPKDGHCLLCGQKMEPLLSDMGTLAMVSGQQGWVFGWWHFTSRQNDEEIERIR